MTTLYRAIDTLGGTFDQSNLYEAGYDQAITDVLELLGKRGHSEDLDPVLEALEQVQHSIKQAMIPGNDWRRELQLIANTADAAITLATGEA